MGKIRSEQKIIMVVSRDLFLIINSPLKKMSVITEHSSSGGMCGLCVSAGGRRVSNISAISIQLRVVYMIISFESVNILNLYIF